MSSHDDYVLYEKNANNIFLILYWINSLYNIKEYKYFYGDINRKYTNLKKIMSSAYFDYKLKYINESDNEIYIRIFYNANKNHVGFVIKDLCRWLINKFHNHGKNRIDRISKMKSYISMFFLCSITRSQLNIVKP